ncbi:MAG: glycosyltransferase family 4 protein [Chloroflexi bacterium]|jgi:glycosyltransferase involved in cell wall biosynthesis|nr:glycosyltransferase family 1 protein [Chloroflexota bacterium]MBV6437524.1 D-inositol-3-phosphate glycosyltransferase [Anaerolineae bacterium]MDL1916880.1 glycosyltransferase family 4 protein [Anaerolineae bacterium CFX4]OQY84030.1 MAG: hypothetical protein B6D42_06255 [Anaerolineae bacterium UTCFX5]MCC6564980.1 glycosyltransferase family 4 protein [Chloroflexota bacterium]
MSVQRVIPVELVEFGASDVATGIGHYAHAIQGALMRQHAEMVDPCLRRFHSLPGANRFQILRHLPIGIANRRPGSIVHFVQIMGSAMLRYRTIHPSVIAVHDLGMLVSKEDDTLFTPLDRMLMYQQFLGLRCADRLSAASAFNARGLQETLGIPPDRIRVIHHGVDAAYRERPRAEDYTVLDRYRPPRPPGMLDLLYVGSELPRKNLATLLKMVAILKARGQSVRLIKAGGAGGERWRQATIQQISALGLEADVVFTGRVDEAHLPMLYRAADVFVTTSRLEGFGLPTAEAMASGIPIVCSDTTAFPEVVGDAGLLVSPDDPEAAAAAVLRMRDDPALRESFIEKGVQRAALYTWENAAAKLADLYAEIASTGDTRSSR